MTDPRHDYPCYQCNEDCSGCNRFNEWMNYNEYDMSERPLSLDYGKEDEDVVVYYPEAVEGGSQHTGTPARTYYSKPPTQVYTWCKHQDWLEFKAGEEEVRLFLKSSSQTVDAEVDVFIDLTSNEPSGPYVPKHLRSYLPEDYGELEDWCVGWKVIDGNIGSDALVDFALSLIADGKTIGFGCIGGHGRTGWLACRLYKALTGCTGDEAVDFVRTNYCSKAVETQKQMDNLGSTRGPRYAYGGATV